ncbi:MAG: glycerol kinase GlpK [Oscillospiraceae bacterium]|jgi:glycerol kinase
MKKYILALDQGTTSSRAIIFDRNQNIAAVSQQDFRQIYPKPGYVEHDPYEIFSSQNKAMQNALSKSCISPHEISGIGITNQRETTIVWDKKTGEPVMNAIVWQCRRTACICEEMIKAGYSQRIREKTGLIIDAYFSATKIKWILDNIDGARKKAENGELLFGTVDTWLVWKLTGGRLHITDYTNASRTMLFNIHTLCWDADICRLLDIPMCMLPQVRNSSEIYGSIKVGDAEIPIAAMAGDQQAALFGQTCFEKGEAKNTYGTGCFLLLNTGEAPVLSENRLLSTIASGINGEIKYALEGSVFIGGAIMQWLRDEMGLIDDVKNVGKIAASVSDNGGVYIVPAFTGLGAPHWDMYARGSIFGITRGTNRRHIIRAAEEAIAFQTNDLISAVSADFGEKLTEIKSDGGASSDDFLMQLQADITGINVVRPVVSETTALGAAFLAGLATGFWSDKSEIKALWKSGKSFSFAMEKDKREALIKGWQKAVSRTLYWESN